MSENEYLKYEKWKDLKQYKIETVGIIWSAMKIHVK